MKNSRETLFFDEFTAPHLNAEAWNVEKTGKIYNNELQAYVDTSETVFLDQTEPDADGVLVLQGQYRPGYVTPFGAKFDFISGRIHTRDKQTFRYGRVSARLKMPPLTGAWPAFWTLGTSGVWPDCGEIDIMEAVGEPDWVSAAVHGPNFYGETAMVNRKYFQPPQSIASWHIYAVECTPDELLFFVDDELSYRVTRQMVQFSGTWSFDTEKYIILNLALGGMYPFKINHVHKPYYGLPETSLEYLKHHTIQFLVDWVKISAL